MFIPKHYEFIQFQRMRSASAFKITLRDKPNPDYLNLNP